MEGFLKCFLKMANACGGKDLTLRYASSTQTWHAAIGSAWRGSSTLEEGAMEAMSQAFTKYKEYEKRKAERLEEEENDAGA